MLSKELPRILHPEQLCRSEPPKGIDLSGEIPFARLRNLPVDLPSQPETLLYFSLHFAQDENKRCYIRGEMHADVTMICQRCLQPVCKTVQWNILVSPVNSDAQAKQLPTEYEPLLMSEGAVDLTEWFAEELHLALPFIPCHDTNCAGDLNLINSQHKQR